MKKYKRDINKIYEIYNYDSILFDFEKLIRQNLNKIEALKDLDELSNIDKFINRLNLNRIEQNIYKIFKEDAFQNLYEDFNLKVIKPLFQADYKFQRVPSIRISTPGNKTVNFHNDCWYGHDDNVINIWVPLTVVRGSQSLAFLNKKENEEALNYFYREEPSLLEIQNYCEKKSSFAEVNYGQFIKFPTSSLHGTFKNSLPKTRVSFDFRLNFSDNNGLKNKSFFIDFKDNLLTNKNKKLIKKQKKAIGYLNQKEILGKFLISQTIQQETIANYCQLNNIDLIAQETELIGFNKALNLEDIFFGNRKEEVKDIIVFSEKLLFLEHPDNMKIIKSAIAKDYHIHLINEGYILNKDNFKILNYRRSN